MSAPENLDTRARLLGYARWAAIGLAALAALIIAAFSGATALRVAAFMAVIAVVLVVLSITMNGAASTKVHLEETLLDEIDALREDMRADITTAARATHRAVVEKVAHLHQNIETMRRDIDANRALGEGVPPRPGVGSAPARRAIAAPAAAGVVHHTETVHVTTHQTYVDPVEPERAERVVQRSRSERDDRPVDNGWDTPARVDDRPRAGAQPAWNDGHRGYTERDERRPYEAPYDDRAADDRGLRREDRPYAGGDDSRGRRPASGGRPPAEDGWADPRLREPASPVSDPYDDSSEIAAWRNPRSFDRDDDPAEDPRWSGVRAGDRWAEVRTDDRGRELRMGERRTAIRADETGTQMRIVDRWSSVREETPSARRDPAAYDAPGHGGTGRRSADSGYGTPGSADGYPSAGNSKGFRTGNGHGATSGRTPADDAYGDGGHGSAGGYGTGSDRGASGYGTRSDTSGRMPAGGAYGDGGHGSHSDSGSRAAGGYGTGSAHTTGNDNGSDGYGPGSSYGSDYGSGYGDVPSAGFRGGADNTGESRRDRRRREEAQEAAATSHRPDDERRSDRRSDAAPSWSAPDRSRPALPSAGPEPAAGWIRGRDASDADSRRSRRDISGEVIPPSRSPQSTPRGGGGGDASWSAPRRPGAEARPVEREQVRPEYRPADDNRWEREPSGGRSAIPRRLDFNDADDRWR